MALACSAALPTQEGAKTGTHAKAMQFKETGGQRTTEGDAECVGHNSETHTVAQRLSAKDPICAGSQVRMGVTIVGGAHPKPETLMAVARRSVSSSRPITPRWAGAMRTAVACVI